MLLICKRIPYLSDITIAQNVESMKRYFANQLKNPPTYYLTENSTYYDLDKLLNEIPTTTVSLPIVEEDTMKLLGVVQTTNLKNLLRRKSDDDDSIKFFINRIISILPFRIQRYISNCYDPNEVSIPYDINPFDILPYPEPIGMEDPNNSVLNVDLSPYTVFPTATLAQIYFMFTVDICPTAFVTDNGILTGVIEREHLIEFISNQNH